MNLSADQVKGLADIIGARDHDALAAELQKTLSAYELHRWGGRDTFPTVAEAHHTCMEIEERLTWIMNALLGREQNPFLLAWLSSAMTGKDKGGTEFSNAVMALWDVVHKVNDDFVRHADKPFEVDGVEHRRKTRTEARDKALMPLLIACAQVHGDPDLVGDDTAYEAVDTICEFLVATMNTVGISAPDAGDTMHGEVNQGRLRRMVKDTLKKHRAMRESMLDK